MATRSASTQELIQHAESLLNCASRHMISFDDGRESIGSLFNGYQIDEYFELCKGRKKGGSPEAVMASFGKAMKALLELRKQLQLSDPVGWNSSNPSLIRDPVTQKPAARPASQSREPASVPAGDLPASSSSDPLPVPLLIIPLTDTDPAPLLESAVKVNKYMSLVNAWVPHVLYFISAFYFGGLLITGLANPAFWINVLIDIASECCMIVPNYLLFVSHETLAVVRLHISQVTKSFIAKMFWVPFAEPNTDWSLGSGQYISYNPPSTPSAPQAVPGPFLACLFIVYVAVALKFWAMFVASHPARP